MDILNSFDGRQSRIFDFTLQFERSILSVLPASVVLVLAVCRLYSLYARPRRIQGRILEVSKLSAIAAYTCLQLASLILWIRFEKSQLAVAAAAAAVLDACLFLPLSWFEHTRSRQPSTILLLYFTISLIFDIVQLRTLWVLKYETSILGISLACVCMKVLILCLESFEKRRFSTGGTSFHNPEEWSGVWNRGCCCWLNRLLLRGYRHSLSIEDFYPLTADLSSRKLELRLSDHPSIWGIFWTVIEALGWSSVHPVAPRLCLIGFNLSQPLLIKAILKYLQDTRAEDVAHGQDNFMILGTVLLYSGIAVSGSIYWQLHLRNLTKIRGLLVGAVYKKLTTVASTQPENAAVTLMSTDVERVTQGLRVFHEAWANSVEVVIAVWLLQRELHMGSIAPVAIAIACSLVTLCVNKFTMPRQNRWMDALQARINRTVSVLSQIKSIRMLGLGKQSDQALNALRVRELQLANGFRMMMVFSFCIAFAPIFIVPVVCFAIYLTASQNGSGCNAFDLAKAFTSLSLIVILTQPLSSLFQYVPMFAGAANCLQRINDFLHSPSHHDPREQKSDATRECRGPQDDSSSKAEKSTSMMDIAERSPIAGDGLSIYDGAFGWSENQWDIQNVNLNIPKSRLTVITGPIASGKSTLCKAFLGEIPYVKGIVKISSGTGIGFCDQTPYLTNTTIYENIIGRSAVNDAWYKTVIRAVDLETDFERLSSGDRTLVGNNGDALSTGQKQRVAIARAVYARKPLIILDDVFSGMDNVTKTCIYERLLSPKGLLRHLETTVILACSDQDLCLAADLVVELAPGRPPVAIHPASRTKSDYHAEGQQEAVGISKISNALDIIQAKTDQTAVSGAVQKQASKAPSDWATYGYFARAVETPNTALLIFLGGVFGTLYTFPSVWVNWWTTDPAARDSFYFGIYALLQATGLICWFLFTRHCLTTVVSRSGKKLHNSLLSTVMSASFPYLSTKDSGTIINRFSQDLQSVDGELPAALLNTVATAFIALAQVALVATASPWLTISYPFLILVFYGIQRFYLRTSQQLRPLDIELKGPLYTHFLDTLRGITTVRAFGWSQQYVERNQQLLDASQRPNYLLQMIQQWLSLVLNVVVVVIVTLLVTLSLKLRSSLGLTAVALVNLMSLSQMLRSVVIGWALMETSITAVARIKEFELTTPRENDLNSEGAMIHGAVSGKIEYKNLTVSYGLSNENLALKNVNLVIEAGQKIGVCGRSGSGKSSLVASLFRLLDVRQGKIVIDTNDINDYSLSNLRSNINAIPQDPFITSGNFREVLDPYGASPDHAIQEALRKVKLFEYVQSHGGLEGSVKSESLSHGQKQLLSLARAILRRCSIVVLDEVTSSLDLETEQLIWDVLQEEFRGCTIVAIAHRLETIVSFDRVAVMDEGISSNSMILAFCWRMLARPFSSCERRAKRTEETAIQEITKWTAQ
ncbi:ABC transporter FUM19 [Colletotrichum gloeosporioides]|uniref:ABC transporter FUM19 n=1 Tax=Colletotrichum gloeosporioides TaxID=474922 RepID=A0A8H4FJ17_COLGL|nr:ABC transporter FUM19 [Colletotrichum gloeosporioides]KAF3803885.1 ABC transporter FUM19 [Colletotrichum gloeosporioides]